MRESKFLRIITSKADKLLHMAKTLNNIFYYKENSFALKKKLVLFSARCRKLTVTVQLHFKATMPTPWLLAKAGHKVDFLFASTLPTPACLLQLAMQLNFSL